MTINVEKVVSCMGETDYHSNLPVIQPGTGDGLMNLIWQHHFWFLSVITGTLLGTGLTLPASFFLAIVLDDPPGAQATLASSESIKEIDPEVAHDGQGGS